MEFQNDEFKVSRKDFDLLQMLNEREIVKKSAFSSFVDVTKERVFKNLGTTVTGISLNYEPIVTGYISKDYVMLGKGLINMLAFMYTEDPFKDQSSNLNPQNTQ